jgi:hypothetical protein
MPRSSRSRGNQKSGKPKGSRPGRPTLDVSGFMSRMGLPIPRLPFLIGSDGNLSPVAAVYPRMVKLDFPIIIQTASVVAGGVSLALQCNVNNLIENFSTRVGSLFGEYAIVGLRIEVRVNNVAVPSGLYLAYFNEKGTGAPTIVEALNTPHVEGLLSNTESPSKHLLEWKASDYLDLDWQDNAASTYTPVTFKIFASSATGTQATTTGTLSISGAVALCLRAYSG